MREKGFNVQNARSARYQELRLQGPQGNVCTGTIGPGRKEARGSVPGLRVRLQPGCWRRGCDCPAWAGTTCRDLGTAAEAAPSSRAWSRWWPGTQSWSSDAGAGGAGRCCVASALKQCIHICPRSADQQNGLIRSVPGARHWRQKSKPEVPAGPRSL